MSPNVTVSQSSSCFVNQRVSAILLLCLPIISNSQILFSTPASVLTMQVGIIAALEAEPSVLLTEGLQFLWQTRLPHQDSTERNWIQGTRWQHTEGRLGRGLARRSHIKSRELRICWGRQVGFHATPWFLLQQVCAGRGAYVSPKGCLGFVVVSTSFKLVFCLTLVTKLPVINFCLVSWIIPWVRNSCHLLIWPFSEENEVRFTNIMWKGWFDFCHQECFLSMNLAKNSLLALVNLILPLPSWPEYSPICTSSQLIWWLVNMLVLTVTEYLKEVNIPSYHFPLHSD